VYRLLTTFFFLYSCAYTPGYRSLENSKLSQCQLIYVPLFDNLSHYPQIENFYSRELIQGLVLLEGEGRVSTQKSSQADCFLLGVVEEAAVKRGPGNLLRPAGSPTTYTGLGSGNRAQNKPVPTTASSLVLSLNISLKLVKKDADGRKTLFSASYPLLKDFKASERTLLTAGASSAPFINASRASLVHRLLARDFSRKSLVQLSSSF